MKITCQSCQAKYTIADDKVAGKTVKIKCKKCGMAIVVHGDGSQPPTGGYEPGGAPQGDTDDAAETRVFAEQAGGAGGASGDEWLVNVAEGDERTMTTAQLIDEYARGGLSNDTYVWRDGMTDWLPIANVPELAQHVGQAPAAMPAAAAMPEPAMGLGGTFVMDSPPRASTPAGAPRPVSTPPPAERSISSPPAAAAAAPVAARRAVNRGGVDLFGAAERADQAASPSASSPPPADRLVGERNENSVLFSLSALTAAETAAKAPKKEEKAVIDMRPRSGGPAPARNNGRAGFDDIMNLGGGGLGSPILAPPPLLAPVVEAPPPPQVAMAAPVGGLLAIPEMPKKKSPVGLIVGVVGAVGVVGLVAFLALNSGEPPPTTQEQAATAPTATMVATAPTAAPSDTVTETKPETTAASTATAAAGPATVAQGGPRPPGPGPGTSKTTEKDPPKEPDKPPTPPPAETTAATAPPGGGSKEFNRGAATAALGSAAAAAKSCKKPDGPTGSGKVSVTFAPSGNVTSATVQGPPFAGTSVGGCIAGVFRGARVPPFDGAPVTASKSFSIN